MSTLPKLKIINTMFGKGLGGIEQAFLDYNKAIEIAGHEVIAIVQPKAAIIPELKKQNIKFHEVTNFSKWDAYATYKLWKTITKERPDVIICHGNRALSLMAFATIKTCPVIGISHNYSIDNLKNADAVFSITRTLKKEVEQAFPNKKAYHIPNMIEFSKALPKTKNWQSSPVIGTIGRMVHKKGFHIFIEALHELKKRDIPFKAIIAGDGKERKNIEAQITKLQLEDHIELSGWIKNKEEFFDNIDIFCLPSLHEPFGIVLLEAFTHNKPVVTTDSEGPSEICTDGENAFIVVKNDASALAYGLTYLLINKDAAENIAKNGFKTAKEKYDINIVAKYLSDALEDITKLH